MKITKSGKILTLFDAQCKNHQEIFEMPLRNYWGVCSNLANIPENGSKIVRVCLCSEPNLTGSNVLYMFHPVHFTILNLKFHALVNSFTRIFIFFYIFLCFLFASFIYLAFLQSKINRLMYLKFTMNNWRTPSLSDLHIYIIGVNSLRLGGLQFTIYMFSYEVNTINKF